MSDKNSKNQAYYDPTYKDILIQEHDSTGNFTRIQISGEWIAKRKTNWRQKLTEIAGNHKIVLNGFNSPAWYYQGQFIATTPNLRSHALKLLGVNENWGSCIFI